MKTYKVLFSKVIQHTLLVIAGIVQTYATCSPYTGETKGWLQIICAAVLCSYLSRSALKDPATSPADGIFKGWRQPFTYGYVFALSWLGSTFWWIYISLHTYGGLPSSLAVISVVVLAGGLSVYYATVCALYSVVSRNLPNVAKWFLFGALWTTAELARGEWFSGFPWGAVGYAHLDSPLKLLAPYIGVYAVGAIAMTLAALLSYLYRIFLEHGFRYLKKGNSNLLFSQKIKWLLVFCFYCSLTLPLASIISRVENLRDSEEKLSKAMSFSLLQGNIGQDIKYGTEGLKALNWYKDKIMEAKTDWIITPETAVPVLKVQLPEGYLTQIIDHLKKEENHRQSVLIGLIGTNGDGYTNSAEGINAQGEVFQYSKHHLVPFGEFIPPWFKWFTDLMRIPLGSFTRGELDQPSWEVGEQRVAVNICYEDVFGEEIAKSFIKQEGTEPTVMVNMSNIGWFGPFLAVEQHLNASRMRAVEMHRPVLRATNTGATAFIDQNGYVKGFLQKYTQGVLVGEIQGVLGPATFYAKWSGQYGLMPLWFFCTLYSLICLSMARYKKKKSI